MKCGEMEKESEKEIGKFLSEGHKFTQHIRGLIKRNTSIRMKNSGDGQQSIILPEMQMDENTHVADRLKELRPTGKNVFQNVPNIGGEKLLLLEPIKTHNDSLALEFLKKIVDLFHINVFVATGTLSEGATAEAAKVFREVHTIELSRKLYQRASQRFQNNGNVHVYHGDSAVVLQNLLPRIKGKSVFWLDGHYSGGETARGNENTPIIQEIQLIRKHDIQDAVILIDDIRCFYRESNPASLLYGYPTIRSLFSAILEINPTYCFEIIGDVAIAYPSRAGIKISSVIRGCTISRFYDENPELGNWVLDAEQNVSRANGLEQEAISTLCKRFGLSKSSDWGKYYALWFGLILYNQKRLTEATQLFTLLISHNFNHWRIQWYLARAAYESGNLPMAKASLLAVLNAKPDFKDAQKLMAMVKTNTFKEDAISSAVTIVESKNRQTSNKLFVNIVYGHCSPNDISVHKRGNIFILWSRLPIKGCDHYVYHNAFSYRGRLSGLNILLMLEPAVVLPGEFDDRVWDHFDHVFGLFDALTKRDPKFHKIFFPRVDAIPETPPDELREKQETRYPLSGRRNAICMISGNKRSHVASELYSKRIEMAQWFYQNSTIPFDVYGKPPFDLPNYRGIIPDGEKLAVLKQYRFSLCFENTNHPVLSAGYITEKIVDCLEVRTVPIYLGACNIEKYIPEDCFIDYRKFASPAGLESYLQSMSEAEYQRRISAIDQWIAEGNLGKYTNQPLFDALAQLCAEASGVSPENLFGDDMTWTEGEAVSPTGNGWSFVDNPPVWTWNELATAAAPVVKDGELVRKTREPEGLPSYPAPETAGMVVGRVSIIIPVTESAGMVEKCLSNIQKTSEDTIEIILAIDESSPAAIEEIQKASRKMQKLRVINIELNLGPAKLINRAASASTGEYILLLDPSVTVTRNTLSGMLACLKNSPNAGVIGPMSNFSKGPHRSPALKFTSDQEIENFARDLRRQNQNRRIPSNDISVFCMLFTRKLFQELGGFDKNYGLEGGEARDFCIKAAMSGKINFIAGDVYVHRWQTDPSLRRNKRPKEKWGTPDQQTLQQKQRAYISNIESGIEAYHKDDLDNAFGYLLEAIKHLPLYPAAYFELAGVLLKSHNYKDGLNVIKELPSGADDARKDELLGFCFLGLNLDQEALRYAERTLSINQASPPALNLMGLLALKQGDKGKAGQFFNQSLAEDPGYGEPHTNLGKILLENAPEKALDSIERGFILSPDTPDILSAYHSIVTDLGQYQRAEAVFKSAVSAYPLNKILRYRFIDVLFRLGKHEASLIQIEELMALFELEDGMLAAALKIREMTGPREIPRDKKTEKTGLSICMIVKDEEAFLVNCLHSVTPIADEIIIVDTGSTDRTREIAIIFGARVYDFKWNQDFSAARNYALSKANGDWIFVVDADEVISQHDHHAFRKLVRKSAERPRAWSFTTRNYVDSPNAAGWTGNDGRYRQEEKGTGWHPSPKVRLFPNDKRIYFKNPVHEFVEPSLMKNGIAIKECDIPVHHYGQLDWNKYLDKGEQYYLLGKAKLEETGEDLNALIELATQAGGAFGKYEEAVELWKRVLKIDPQNTKALINMGSALMRLKEYEAALEASETALELDPGLKGAVMNSTLCELLLERDLGKVITKLEKLLNDTSDYPAAMALLGSAYVIDGEKGKAVEKMEALGNQGFSRDYYLHDLAKKLIAAGQSQKAVLLLQFAVESGNASDEIRELLRSLKISGQ